MREERGYLCVRGRGVVAQARVHLAHGRLALQLKHLWRWDVCACEGRGSCVCVCVCVYVCACVFCVFFVCFFLCMHAVGLLVIKRRKLRVYMRPTHRQNGLIGWD